MKTINSCFHLPALVVVAFVLAFAPQAQINVITYQGQLSDGAKVIGGTITNLNASNLSLGTIPVAWFGTNTPTATTFLRSDNTWATISGGGSFVRTRREKSR